MKNIKHFSCSREKAEIVAYVEGKFVMGDEFALRLPITLVELIPKGILHFTPKSTQSSLEFPTVPSALGW
jgi:hypothetical protein